MNLYDLSVFQNVVWILTMPFLLLAGKLFGVNRIYWGDRGWRLGWDVDIRH